MSQYLLISLLHLDIFIVAAILMFLNVSIPANQSASFGPMTGGSGSELADVSIPANQSASFGLSTSNSG